MLGCISEDFSAKGGLERVAQGGKGRGAPVTRRSAEIVFAEEACKVIQGSRGLLMPDMCIIDRKYDV